MLIDDGKNRKPTIFWLGHLEDKGLVRVTEEEEGAVSTESISTFVHELYRSSVGEQETLP